MTDSLAGGHHDDGQERLAIRRGQFFIDAPFPVNMSLHLDIRVGAGIHYEYAVDLWRRGLLAETFTRRKSIMDKNAKLKQLTLRIPESLHREFKVSTAKKGQSMGEVALELIRQYLKKDAEPM